MIWRTLKDESNLRLEQKLILRLKPDGSLLLPFDFTLLT